MMTLVPAPSAVRKPGRAIAESTWRDRRLTGPETSVVVQRAGMLCIMGSLHRPPLAASGAEEQ
jgi:hypothetical protein